MKTQKLYPFQVGDGMTTENSTAEERREIRDLIVSAGYDTSWVFKNDSLNHSGLCFTKHNEFYISDHLRVITNPLTYDQMKSRILGAEITIEERLQQVEQTLAEIKAEMASKAVVLEVGKWYKTNYSIFRFLGGSENENFGWGKGYGLVEGEWVGEEDEESFNGWSKNCNWKPATESEVSTALIAEAKKRGLVEGAYFYNDHLKGGSVKTPRRFKSNEYKYDVDKNTLCLSGWLIFQNGVWATPIPTLTKAEAEEKLQCKIID